MSSASYPTPSSRGLSSTFVIVLAPVKSQLSLLEAMRTKAITVQPSEKSRLDFRFSKWRSLISAGFRRKMSSGFSPQLTMSLTLAPESSPSERLSMSVSMIWLSLFIATPILVTSLVSQQGGCLEHDGRSTASSCSQVSIVS